MDALHLRPALISLVTAGALPFMGAEAFADPRLRLESTAVVANGSFAAEQQFLLESNREPYGCLTREAILSPRRLKCFTFQV